LDEAACNGRDEGLNEGEMPAKELICYDYEKVNFSAGFV
jgi:hypothetical protein